MPIARWLKPLGLGRECGLWPLSSSPWPDTDSWLTPCRSPIFSIDSCAFMIRAALWTNHLSDLPQLADVQKSSRPVKVQISFVVVFFLAVASFAIASSLSLHSPISLFPYLARCFAEWKLLFRIPLCLTVVFFLNNYSLNFLILFIIQAPPPPTSCPCAPVGCRAISLAVCLQPLFHRSTAHCLHMRKGDTHLHSYSLFLSPSLFQAHAYTHRPILWRQVPY